MTFEDFSLDTRIIEALGYMGIEQPTPIQELAIPEILAGHDLIASAQTGTGKTAAFVLPVLHKIMNGNHSPLNTLILVPTRELAIQIDQQLQGITYFSPVKSIAVYGGGDGDDWVQEKNALTSGVEIVIATPGKLKSHLSLGTMKFDSLRHLILDEADRMLDIGFYDDIMAIIAHLPQERQTLMFSATMPPKVQQMARKLLHNPKEIKQELSKPAEGVIQEAYLVYDQQKPDLVNNIISANPDFDSILIFSSTRKGVQEVVKKLQKKNSHVEGISSDLEQKEREEVLNRFKARQTRVLVATDVLSRGIDVKDINLIINYDVPRDAEDYVHRVGRTARAKSTGVAITLINEDDMFRFSRIEKLIEREIPKSPLPEGLGNGPAWDTQKKPYSDRRDERNGSSQGKRAGKFSKPRFGHNRKKRKEGQGAPQHKAS